MMWKGLLAEYKEFLPVTDKTPMLTLHEGNTPLIHLAQLSKELGIDLHVKVEGLNPTGSFKDRGMVMAVAKAKEEGSNTVICASTGNTSAAAAAYASRAGMRCIAVTNSVPRAQLQKADLIVDSLAEDLSPVLPV